MSKITVKSTKPQILAAYEDAIRELELTKRQLADVTTEKGILLSEVTMLQSELTTARAHSEHFEIEAGQLQQQLDAAKSQVIKQGQVIAAQPKSATAALPKPAPKPLSVSAEVESQPTVEINDFDRAMYAKFKALPREQRLAIIEFARPIVGHVGIHNIVTVRDAWHEYQAQAEVDSEQELNEIYGSAGDKHVTQYLNSIDPDMQAS